MVLAENRSERRVAGNIRTLVLKWRDDSSEGNAQANAFLPSEARDARRVARNIGGSCPDIAFANSRHRHRIARPQRENRSDAQRLTI